MSENKQPEWRTEHTICSYDVDPQETARLPSLCRFMQEAAYHHAEHLGLGHSFLLTRNLAWVLARQRIQISRLPKWGDSVRIRTWPSGRDRLFFYRDFEMAGDDGMQILQASMAWSLIDTQTRERAHPDTYLKADLPEGIKVFAEKLGRLKGCEGSDSTFMPVTYGDLDMNGHVNNVRYIEWVLNHLPLEFHRAHVPAALEVNYLAEAVYGQSVEITSEEIESSQFSHLIKIGDTDLFRARSSWKKVGA